jgi:hypothetical protein
MSQHEWNLMLLAKKTVGTTAFQNYVLAPFMAT